MVGLQVAQDGKLVTFFPFYCNTPTCTSIGYVHIGLETISPDGNLPFTGST
jgi:hypothetical protein